MPPFLIEAVVFDIHQITIWKFFSDFYIRNIEQGHNELENGTRFLFELYIKKDTAKKQCLN